MSSRPCGNRLAALLVAVLLAPLSAAADEDPGRFVESKSQQLLEIIKREKVHYRETPERFIKAIQSELEPLVDMRIAVRKVMGPHFSQATREQKRRFLTRFRDSMIEAFAKAIAEFDFDSIEVTSSNWKEGSRQATVGMNIRTRSSEVSLIYYLYRARNGDWKLFNIRMDGADLTSAYVGQFSSRMATYNDIDKVIDTWGG